MRHGKAETAGPDWPRDELRPLSDIGVRRTRKSAAGLRKLSQPPEAILSSPLVRARQTAEIVHEGLGLERGIEVRDSLAGYRAAPILEDADAANADAVLLVGHEPTLSALVALLIGANQHADIRLRPGSIAKLTATGLYPGPCATLQWLATPKMLASLA